MSAIRNSIVLSILFIILSLNLTTYSQSFTFPVDGKSVDDISSSFGPRNLGPTADDNYPDADYDYDFHCALDIAASQYTDVFAVWGGVVAEKEDHYIIIKHTDDIGDYWVKYQHIVPTVNKGNSVSAGGKIGDIDNENHLDIRYYPWEAPQNLDVNACHPYDILVGMDEGALAASPIIVDKFGDVMYDHYGFTIESDTCTLHQNPAGAYYFEFGVRVYRVECDLQGVDVYMSAYDESGNSYNEKDLLDTSDVQYPAWPNTVEYFPYVDKNDNDGDYDYDEYIRYNCGDQPGNEDDKGHNSTSVGIYPKYLGGSDTYHTVYFRWYINESLWSNLGGNVKIKIVAYDWYDNKTPLDNLEIQVCLGCEPPEDAPGVPTLTSANYIQSSRSIKLEYEQDWGSEPPEYFIVYRCLSNETMTDDDVIGISSHSSEYYDDSAELKPGISYKYAVAGVNYAGEGYNSNMLSETYGEELPSTISSNTELDGIYYSNGTTISSGVTLTIEPGTELWFNSGKNLTVYGALDAQGTAEAPIFFTSSQSSPSAGDWYGIYFGNSSIDASCILKYCDIRYATYGVYAYNSYPTVHSCWIHNNTYGLRGCSSSMIVNNNKIYDNSQDGGYLYGGTPKFYTNTIYNNTGNGLKFFLSSGKIGYTSGTSQGKNEIRDNGSWGIYAQDLTEIFMGSSDSEGNRIGGYNAVMDNVINEACSYDAHIEAEYNYWGTSSPTLGLFTLVYGGTIDYLPALTYNPNGGSGLSKSVGLSGLDNIANNGHNRWAGYNPSKLNLNKLSDLWLYGLELTLHNCPKKAIEIYKMLIEKFPESKEAKKAMVKIHHLLRESDEKSQENYFENLLHTDKGIKEGYKSTALTLAAHTYVDMDQPVQAVRTFEKVVEEYPDSSCALDALFSLVMLNLNSVMDSSSARAYLEIMKQEYPCNDQTVIAQTDMGEKVDWSVLNSKKLPKPKAETIDIPTEFVLHNNYPNPFNPITNIRFDLPEATHVTITIYDINGREVVQLVNQNMNAGYRHIIWDAKDKYGQNVASGLYIYQMRTSAGFNKTNKMMLTR